MENDVLTRLERLERSNRRLRATGMLAVALLAALLTMGQAPGGRAVEAESFNVVDRTGRTLATLGAAYKPDVAEGQPVLVLYSADGSRVEASFGWLGDNLGLTISDGGTFEVETYKSGQARVTVGGIDGSQARMGVLEGGTASIWLNDVNGAISFLAQHEPSKDPFLWLIGEDGIIKWQAP